MCYAYTGFIRFPRVRGPYAAVRGAGAAPGHPPSGGLRPGRGPAGAAVSPDPAAGGARQLRLWQRGSAGAADGAGRRPHPDDAWTSSHIHSIPYHPFFRILPYRRVLQELQDGREPHGLDRRLRNVRS